MVVIPGCSFSDAILDVVRHGAHELNLVGHARSDKIVP